MCMKSEAKICTLVSCTLQYVSCTCIPYRKNNYAGLILWSSNFAATWGKEFEVLALKWACSDHNMNLFNTFPHEGYYRNGGKLKTVWVTWCAAVPEFRITAWRMQNSYLGSYMSCRFLPYHPTMTHMSVKIFQAHLLTDDMKHDKIYITKDKLCQEFILYHGKAVLHS